MMPENLSDPKKISSSKGFIRDMHTTRLAIVGGGIVGKLLTIGILKNDSVKLLPNSIALITGKSCYRAKRRMVTLTPASIAYLNECDVWNNKVSNLCSPPISNIKVWIGDASESMLNFDSSEMYGSGVVVSTEAIEECLDSELQSIIKLKPAAIQLFENANIENVLYDEENKHILLKRESPFCDIKCSILIGADGGQSQIRSSCSEIPVVSVDYKSKATVVELCINEDDLKSIDEKITVAVQRFLPTGPVALLPLGKGGFSLVWSLPNEISDTLNRFIHENTNDSKMIEMIIRAAFLLNCIDLQFMLNNLNCLSKSELHSLIEERGEQDNFIPRFIKYLKLIPDSHGVFPLRLMYSTKFINSSKNVVLVGDAAHIVHPIGGQGLNLGISGVKTLQNVISESFQLGESNESMIQSIDQKYRRKQQFKSILTLGSNHLLERLLCASKKADRLFKENIPIESNYLLSKITRFGFLSIERLPSLKVQIHTHIFT